MFLSLNSLNSVTTRKHSSRMRTIRCSDRRGGGVRGVHLLGGVPSKGGVPARGMYLPGDGQGVYPSMSQQTPPLP